MYNKSITTNYRTAFIFAIDLSGSMSETITYRQRQSTKAEAVADVVNMILSELVERARREDGVRDYYDVAVIGYGDSDEGIHSLLGEDNRPFISVCELDKIGSKRTISVDRQLHDGSTAQHTLHRREWVHPRAAGVTPMYGALWVLHKLVKSWCEDERNHNGCHPFVFNISDGMATDCNWQSLVAITDDIKRLGTKGGNALMVNVHLCSEGDGRSLIFPTEEEIIESDNDFLRAMGESASYMPDSAMEHICSMRGVKPPQRFKALSYNASIAELLSILNIGSISVRRG